MTYVLVLFLALGGTPQEFVGTTAFETLAACNARLNEIALLRIQGNWMATCRGEVRA